MPRPPPDVGRLTLLLQSRGPTPSRTLLEALGISPATLNRLVVQLGPAVERLGAARSTRYALRRSVRNFGSQWPVYRIGDDGCPRVWAELRALHGGFRVVLRERAPRWLEREYTDGLFSGLPFFLRDVSPQGYLGRAIARALGARLGMPADPRSWNDDDALCYFLIEGYDVTGDFVIGDHALERALRAQDDVAGSIRESDRNHVYPERATAAQRGEVIGSSAGGEQPKFLATLRREGAPPQPVMVKFSAAEPSPVSERWADLLCCEHLAAETLRARGMICARTEIRDAGGRRFLEIERFDRVNGIGRRGLLTLGALEDTFLEYSSSDWTAAAGMLEAEAWISPSEARALRWMWCFGDLIANNDMHRANASFWFGDELPFRLSPFYDMLPMLYAPGAQGELGLRTFSPRPPVASVMEVWSDAAGAALDFWARVAGHDRISNRFRAVAAENGEIVERHVMRFGNR